jgi:CheY-like chemotaxis protein
MTKVSTVWQKPAAMLSFANTPLRINRWLFNAIVGMTSLLLQKDTDAETLDYVETIRNSCDALLTLINDILDFSKIESGRFDVEDQPFDLVKCVEDSADLLTVRTAEKKLQLTVAIDPTLPRWIRGDVTRLRQILVNLLGNAVKFTESGEVTLTIDMACEAAPSLHFAVRDTGCGIPAEYLDRLFKVFSQVDASTTRKHGGTGLGLAISKKLTEIMGGRIWVESESGKGSVFQFILPLRAAEQQDLVKEPDAVWRGKKAFIVDRNATNRRNYDAHLRHWGLQTVTAGTTHEALDCIRQQRFDIALFDSEMPEVSGIELAQQVADLGLAPGMRIILSGAAGTHREQYLKGMENPPFHAFLSRPTRLDALREVVSQLMSSAPSKFGRTVRDNEIALAKRHPLRVLLAEDNVVNQKVSVALLRRMGYDPDVAANGLEALAAVHRQTYDVVLMDVQMPEMDGLEASRRIVEEFGAGTRPRLIALTANVFKSDQDECLAAGMDDFFGKPLDFVRLREALCKCQQQPVLSEV